MSNGNTFSVDELREMAERIARDPDAVDEMTPEQVKEVRRYTNPYGANFSAKKSWANISITNFRDEFFKKMYLTGVVAFLFQLASEAQPDAEIDEIKAECKRQCDTYKADHKAGQIDEARYRELVAFSEDCRDRKIATITRMYRNVINRFLNRQFVFDPMRHVRPAKSTGAGDPERGQKTPAWAEAQAERGKAVAAKMDANPALLYKYLRDNTLASYQIMTETQAMLKSICSGGGVLSPEDFHGVALKLYGRAKGMVDNMRAIAEPLSAAQTVELYRVNPPADVFHNFGRFMSNNFEAMVDGVREFFGLRPDFEFAITYHRAFKSEEAAREHRIAHENEFRGNVFTIENNGITLLGAYKENAAKVDFYNKNTEILKNMMEQNAADAKLGQDLMNKKIRREKQRNIDECGPDGEGLAAFTRSGTLAHDPKQSIATMGAFKGMTREQQEAYIKERDAAGQAQPGPREDDLQPDALECSMYFTDSEGNFKETKFLTQAEAPLHGQDGSDYVDTYQPKREGAEIALTTKTIVGRDGKTKKVKVPAK